MSTNFQFDPNVNFIIVVTFSIFIFSPMNIFILYALLNVILISLDSHLNSLTLRISFSMPFPFKIVCCSKENIVPFWNYISYRLYKIKGTIGS